MSEKLAIILRQKPLIGPGNTKNLNDISEETGIPLNQILTESTERLGYYSDKLPEDSDLSEEYTNHKE